MARTTPSRRAERRAEAPRPLRADAAPSGWEALSRRRQHLICGGFLLLVAVAFYAPLLFSGKTLVGGDAVQWRSMAQSMMAYHDSTGAEPLWSTNAFGGMPGYMITRFAEIPQLDTVLTLLRPFVWPLSHFLVLLAGVYGLVVFLGGRPLAGVLAAVAFGLTAYLPILLGAGHNSKYIALCYAPLLLWAFAYALRRPRLLAGLLFAAALAANLRAGHPQITYYVLFTLGVWWAGEGIAALRARALPAFGRATAWLALGTLLAALMVAHPYLLQAEYKNYTIRGATSEGGGADAAFAYAMAWSQGVGELLTLFVSNAYGGGGSAYWGPKVFTAGPHYVGGIVLLLAAIALARSRRRVPVLALGTAAALMTLFALGDHLAGFNRLMYDHFPLFSAFRVPETWLSVVALVLAVLAGLGAAALVERGDDAGAAGQNRTVLLLTGGAIALALVVYLAGPGLLPFTKPGELEQIAQQVAQQNNVSPSDPRVVDAAQQYVAELRGTRADLFRADAIRTFFFLLAGGALIVLHGRRRVPAWALVGGLALLVTVDLFGVGRRYLDENALVPDADPAARIARYATDDFIVQQVAAAGGPGHFRVLSLTANPSQDARPSYFYESLGGYHGAKLRLYQDFLDHLLLTPDGQLSTNALRLMSTRFVVAGGALPGYRVVFQDPQTGLAVLEDPQALPRAYFVGAVEVLPSGPAMWSRIQEPTFDPARVALVDEGAGVATTPLDSASTARVTLETFGPREIVWQAETDAPRLLVVSEIYYPAGWKAFVDGDEVPIHPVDYLLRGVEVPAGQHTVRMAFRPARYALGLWLSGAGTVLVYGGIVVLLALAWRKKED